MLFDDDEPDEVEFNEKAFQITRKKSRPRRILK
jgi:hypothetical protein